MWYIVSKTDKGKTEKQQSCNIEQILVTLKVHHLSWKDPVLQWECSYYQGPKSFNSEYF